MLPYLQTVLSRRRRDYTTLYEEGQWFIRTQMSSKNFHEAVLRAICEKRTHEEKSGVVYVTQEEHDDPVRLMILLSELGSENARIKISRK